MTCPSCNGDLTQAIQEWENDYEIDTGDEVSCPHCGIDLYPECEQVKHVRIIGIHHEVVAAEKESQLKAEERTRVILEGRKGGDK